MYVCFLRFNAFSKILSCYQQTWVSSLKTQSNLTAQLNSRGPNFPLAQFMEFLKNIWQLILFRCLGKGME